MYEVGLTLGKFMPPHRGHELLIDFGSHMSNKMNVIVSGQNSDEIPLWLRVKWLKKHYQETNVRIISDVDNIPIGEMDENGTVINQEFWDAWKKKILNYVPDVNTIYTSDLYGERLANELGIDWVPVDPNRCAIPISASKILASFSKNFEFIMDEAKSHFLKNVVLIGPESVGKTVMAEKLARMFNSIWIPEYGRTLSEAKKNNLTEEDFYTIYEGQLGLTKSLKKYANQVIIQDTELLTTYLFSKIYLDKELLFLKLLAEKQTFDLYILLAPTVEIVNDGTRILNQTERLTFYNDLKMLLDEFEKPYIIVDNKDFKERTKIVYDAIIHLWNDKKGDIKWKTYIG